MGETDTNRTKKSVSIITQTDLGSLANVMKCISNGAARAQVYVEIHGDTVPIHIQCSTLIMSALRHSETRRWFKLHDLEQPWVKFTVITLLSHIMVTLNKAARLPHNQQTLLAGTPERYTKGPLQDCLTSVRSWGGRLQSCVTGGEQTGMTKLYMSTYRQHFKPFTNSRCFFHPFTDTLSFRASQADKKKYVHQDTRQGTNHTPSAPSTKRLKQDTVRANPVNNTAPTGDLLYPGKKPLCPRPTITARDEQPCMPSARYGKICTALALGACDKCHKSINNLSTRSQNEWKAHVLSTEGLFFNSETVTSFPAMDGLYAKPDSKYLKRARPT